VLLRGNSTRSYISYVSFIARKFIIGLIIRYISFDIIENYYYISKPRTFFRCCGLCSCNLLFETNNFGLGAVLLSCSVSELQERHHQDSNPGHFFGIYIFPKSLRDLNALACLVWCKLVYPFRAISEQTHTISLLYIRLVCWVLRRSLLAVS
jgi:hypothetical protein